MTSKTKPSPEQLDELRHAMLAAIEAREKSEIARVFIRATDISAKATGSEVRYKKGKDLKRHAAFREIGLRVDLLRAQWLVATEKEKLRFMGRHGEGIKAGTPAPPHLLTLGDLFPRHSQDQARKLSHDLQSLAKLSAEEFEALVADPDAPRPRSGPEKRVLPLSAIRADERAQPRVGVDNNRVAEYVADMKRRDTFPALIVFEDPIDGRYWLADGFHRYLAAKKLNRKKIKCDVCKGGLREAILYSCRANATHGLKRTNEDKRAAIAKLLGDDEWGKWNDSEIARRCDVGHDLVARVRREREAHLAETQDRPRTVSRGGTTYTLNTANIGGKPKPGEPEASGAEQTLPAGNDTPDDVAQPDKPAPESTESAAEPVVEQPAPSKDDARSVPDLAPAKTDAAPPTAPGQPGPPPDLYGLHCAAVLDTIRGTIRGLTNVDFNQVATIPTDELLEVRNELDEAAGALRAVITRAIESAAVGQETSPPAGHGVREC